MQLITFIFFHFLCHKESQPGSIKRNFAINGAQMVMVDNAGVVLAENCVLS